MRPLQIGLALPLLEASATGEAPRWQTIRTVARQTEGLWPKDSVQNSRS